MKTYTRFATKSRQPAVLHSSLRPERAQRTECSLQEEIAGGQRTGEAVGVGDRPSQAVVQWV